MTDPTPDYRQARANLRPSRLARAEQTTAERVECGPACIRAAGHTGQHLPPIPPAQRDPGCEVVVQAMSGEVAG